MIRYRVAIRRNSDGRVHVTPWEDYLYSLAGLEYWWTEGNMACDCNRHGEFERVADPDCGNLAMEYPCGESEYSLEWFEVEGIPRMTPRELVEYISTHE